MLYFGGQSSDVQTPSLLSAPRGGILTETAKTVICVAECNQSHFIQVAVTLLVTLTGKLQGSDLVSDFIDKKE